MNTTNQQKHLKKIVALKSSSSLPFQLSEDSYLKVTKPSILCDSTFPYIQISPKTNRVNLPQEHTFVHRYRVYFILIDSMYLKIHEFYRVLGLRSDWFGNMANVFGIQTRFSGRSTRWENKGKKCGLGVWYLNVRHEFQVLYIFSKNVPRLRWIRSSPSIRCSTGIWTTSLWTTSLRATSLWPALRSATGLRTASLWTASLRPTSPAPRFGSTTGIWSTVRPAARLWRHRAARLRTARTAIQQLPTQIQRGPGSCQRRQASLQRCQASPSDVPAIQKMIDHYLYMPHQFIERILKIHLLILLRFKQGILTAN